MKKIFIVATMVVSACALTGCGNKSVEGADGTDSLVCDSTVIVVDSACTDSVADTLAVDSTTVIDGLVNGDECIE